MRLAVRVTASVLASVVALGVSFEARADEPAPGSEVAARRGLIEAAQTAREQGEHARALDLARRAGTITMTPSLRRFIAEEEEALAMPAEALGSAELCVREGGSDPAQERHVTACKTIVERAKAAVGHLVVRVEPAPEDARVRVRGVEVPRAVWGAPYVVSPGSIDVEASAAGYGDQKKTVTVVRGAVVEVSLALTALPVTASPVTASPVAPVASSAPRPTEAPHARRSLSPLVPIGGALLLVGAGVALGVGLSARGRLDDYESRCTIAGAPPSCGGEHGELSGDLDTSAVLVNVALGAAVVGAVVGVVGLVVGGRSASSARAPSAWVAF